MNMNRRRAIIGLKKGKLPNEYQEVECLQSTGTQYIDTGVKPTSTMGFMLKVYREDTGNSFGAQYSSSKRFLFNEGGSVCSISYGGTKYSSTIPSTSALVTYLSTVDKCYVNGTEIGNAIPSVLPTTLNLYICGSNNNGTASLGKGKYYECQITDNGTLIRDFIPCYRKADGVAGMYDTVGNQFYTNAGTGSFVVGRPVGFVLPSDYTKVAYIQSTNSAQYIDTGIKPISAYRLQGRVKRASGDVMFASVQGSVSGGTNIIRIDANSTYQYYSNASTSYKAKMGSLDTNWHEFYTNNRTINWDGTAYSVSGGAACTSQDYNLWLFWDNKGGSPNPNYYTGASQIDYFTICDTSGELVRFFESCVRNSDNVAGMYDHISGNFFTNAGTGSFIVGG